MSEQDDPFDDFLLDPTVLIGRWANSTRVIRRRTEFTVDFLRQIPEESRPFLVARALIPPAVAFELRDQLDEGLRGYYDWPMPEEPNDA